MSRLRIIKWCTLLESYAIEELLPQIKEIKLLKGIAVRLVNKSGNQKRSKRSNKF